MSSKLTKLQRDLMRAAAELLQRDQGARSDERIVATGWLPHTMRAAPTGLRHCGYEVRRERGEKGHTSVYRVFAPLAMIS